MIRKINIGILIVSLLLCFYGIFQLFFLVHIYPFGLLLLLCLLAIGSTGSLIITKFNNLMLYNLLTYFNWINCLMLFICFLSPVLLDVLWHFSVGIVLLLIIVSLSVFLSNIGGFLSISGRISLIIFGIMFEFALLFSYLPLSYFYILNGLLGISAISITSLLIGNYLKNVKSTKIGTKA